MGTTKATKAADKSQVCRKFVNALHRLYGKSVPKIELPVVETMLFAACLEDNPWAPAEAGFQKLLSSFFDLNEIRVSSVNELEVILMPLKEADWKGLRIRSILRSVFETTYSYDFEKLRRQTMEQAVKTLKKMADVTPFIRDFVLHEILGSHIVCLDNSMLTAAKWLGLVPEAADLQEGSEYLKGGLKKSEVSEFCALLRCLATDPKFIPRFADHAKRSRRWPTSWNVSQNCSCRQRRSQTKRLFQKKFRSQQKVGKNDRDRPVLKLLQQHPAGRLRQGSQPPPPSQKSLPGPKFHPWRNLLLSQQAGPRSAGRQHRKRRPPHQKNQ